MHKYMIKRTIEHLLEATVFAGTFNKNIANKINDLSLEVLKVQESIGSPKVDSEPIDSAKIDEELKGIINGK